MTESKKRNIMEDIIKDLLERLLALRFDICRCPVCLSTMQEAVTKHFPPYFIDDDISDYRSVFVKVSNQYFKQAIVEVTKAIEYVSKHPPHKEDQDREEAFKELLERIYQDRGIDFTQYHRSLLKRRVALRLRAHNLNSYSEYLKVLSQNHQEYEKLFELLTINVSEFLRDREVWEALKKLLEKIMNEAASSDRPIRIWSAGCANGEEPYSLAILINELAPTRPVHIYATDIDRDSIVSARKGIYNARGLRNVEPELLEKYFISKAADIFALKDEVRKKVVFMRHDLINDNILAETDLILCRNVFIYFTKPLQEQILNKFYHSLRENGYLVIGKTEAILSEARLIFKDIDINNRIYHKSQIEATT